MTLKISASCSLLSALRKRAAVPLLLTVAANFAACSSTGEKGADEGVKGGDSGGGGGGGDKSDDGGSEQASANRVTFTNSLSNNGLTSQTVSTSKADQQMDRYSAGSKDKRTLEGRISAARLARKGTGDVLTAAKRLAEIEMEKGAGRTVSDEVKLELALASIDSKNYALAEYYLQICTDSKNARVKAGAYNALGVIALKDDRVPEAVLYFRQALKAASNYKPALLNLGFAALKGGDLKTAKQALGDMQSDWFVQYALISVERVEGDTGKASDLCEKVLSKEPAHKAALFNCGLVEFQNKKNFGKAKELVNKAAKARGGEDSWDSRSMDMLTQIDMEESSSKQAELRKKQSEPKPGKPDAAPVKDTPQGK